MGVDVYICKGCETEALLEDLTAHGLSTNLRHLETTEGPYYVFSKCVGGHLSDYQWGEAGRIDLDMIKQWARTARSSCENATDPKDRENFDKIAVYLEILVKHGTVIWVG